MTGEVLTDRALNRATLARQCLLERSSMVALDAVERLVGLQAQNPLDPYLALWSRLDSFDPIEVGRLVEDRSLVRIVVMRGTIHLVTADDALVLRPLMQPALDAEIARHREFAPHLSGIDLTPGLAFARSFLGEQPRTPAQLRAAIEVRFPGLHAGAMTYACRCLLPLVQTPPRGVWGKVSQVASMTAESWLGRSLDRNATVDDAVPRYLAAFGPATIADVSAWCRLSGMGEVVKRLRPRLRTFTNQGGRELFDLPDAPRPDPDSPAPVRFLPEYDNVFLSFADRSRFGSDYDRRFTAATGPFRGAVLVEGELHAIWHSEHNKKAKLSTIVVGHHGLSKADVSAFEEEAHRVATFWHSSVVRHDVRLIALS